MLIRYRAVRERDYDRGWQVVECEQVNGDLPSGKWRPHPTARGIRSKAEAEEIADRLNRNSSY